MVDLIAGAPAGTDRSSRLHRLLRADTSHPLGSTQAAYIGESPPGMFLKTNHVEHFSELESFGRDNLEEPLPEWLRGVRLYCSTYEAC